MPRPMSSARATALQHGAATFEGAACPAGHLVRWTRSRACVACQAAAQRQRRGTRAPDFADVLG